MNTPAANHVYVVENGLFSVFSIFLVKGFFFFSIQTLYHLKLKNQRE